MNTGYFPKYVDILCHLCGHTFLRNYSKAFIFLTQELHKYAFISPKTPHKYAK